MSLNLAKSGLGLLIVFTAIAVGAQDGGSEPAASVPLAGLSTEELAAEPPDVLSEDPLTALPVDSLEPAVAPIDIADAAELEIETMAETGYVKEDGRYMVDVLERDYAYLTLQLQTKDGRPVRGAVPMLAIEGTSELLGPEEIATQPTTDEYGVIEFAVVGGQMGLDRVKVQLGDAHTEIFVNVISLQASGFPMLPVIEGGLPWEELMQAKVRYLETTIVADFPATVTQRAGKTVRLSGFMMPLDPDLKQRRFLLTSNPPSCFFHVPGGPAGAVEVFASGGIEVSWDPIVLEGRFEPQQKSEIGVVYRLRDARLVPP